jgi:hypothetical protein
VILFLAAIVFGGIRASAGQGAEPIARFLVAPSPDGTRVSVEAVLRLERNLPYLKDFGQLESIRWILEDKEISVASERQGDILVFKGLPSFGEAKAVYALRCVTEPRPGYRKRLMGGTGFVMAREGLFIGINGRELSPIEVRLSLPPGWSLVLGREGTQRFVDAQKTLWIAGEAEHVRDESVDGKTLRLSVLKGTTNFDAAKAMDAVAAVFRKAWEDCGPLDRDEFGVAVFPRGKIGGGTALGMTLASEDDLPTIIHEMLHWWTNHRLPAWFREGAHTYLAGRIMFDLGLMGEEDFRVFLDGFVKEHERVLAREGRLSTLAESSEAYDKPAGGGSGGGDMYALAPLFARKLDAEMRAFNPKANLWTVFAAVSRARDRAYDEFGRPKSIDLLTLIREKSGYEPAPLFNKYYSVPVKDVALLLR